jgi:hypothetical protein
MAGKRGSGVYVWILDFQFQSPIVAWICGALAKEMHVAANAQYKRIFVTARTILTQQRPLRWVKNGLLGRVYAKKALDVYRVM